eukprot:2970866-Amphidinium_carterae.1
MQCRSYDSALDLARWESKFFRFKAAGNAFCLSLTQSSSSLLKHHTAQATGRTIAHAKCD